jgi:hypothetical protein
LNVSISLLYLTSFREKYESILRSFYCFSQKIFLRQRKSHLPKWMGSNRNPKYHHHISSTWTTCLFSSLVNTTSYFKGQCIIAYLRHLPGLTANLAVFIFTLQPFCTLQLICGKLLGSQNVVMYCSHIVAYILCNFQEHHHSIWCNKCLFNE